MELIRKDVDLAGKWRARVRLSDGSLVTWKFNHDPSTPELEALEAPHIDLHLYDDVEQEEANVLDHEELIREFVTLLRQNPSTTLTQYNNWLGNKNWGEEAVIRFFVYKLATALADKAEITLSSLTENQVMTKLRDWLVNSPVRKIEKVVFNL